MVCLYGGRRGGGLAEMFRKCRTSSCATPSFAHFLFASTHICVHGMAVVLDPAPKVVARARHRRRADCSLPSRHSFLVFKSSPRDPCSRGHHEAQKRKKKGRKACGRGGTTLQGERVGGWNKEGLHFQMLRRVNIWRSAEVMPSLVRRAVLLRWGLLALRWDSETNMCVLADGNADGLPRGTRLEMYGETVQLIKLHTGNGEVSSDDVGAITGAIESALVSLPDNIQVGNRRLRPTAAPQKLPDEQGEGQVIAKWSLSAQQQQQQQQMEGENSPPLMENGVVFPSPHAAGPRVLRAARQTFGLLLENQFHQQQQAAAGNADPIAILDVNELDCSFSHVAMLAAVERDLEPERQFHVSYVPLTNAAAATANANIASLLRLVARPGSRAKPDQLRALQARYFLLGSHTVCSGSGSSSSSSSSNRNRKDGSVKEVKREESAGVLLAHVLSKMHRGGTLLVNLLGDWRVQREREGCDDDDDDDAPLQLLRQEAKALVTEALSRAGRWGVISDEVLPAADCRGLAVSLVLLLD